MPSSDRNSRPLAAGAGRVVITPPLGIRMMGYTVQECVSESIERELTATALVLAAGETKVALLACDILFIQSPHVDRIRERIGDSLGVPAANVLINFSHTHLGPMLPGWHADDPDQTRVQQRYLEFLEESLVGVAVLADSRRQPARIGAATGSAPIGVNRRERLPEGGVMIGENLDGAVEHGIDVVRIDDLAGDSIAVIMSAAAHTVVLGPKTSQLSPDYVGPAREIVESATGALTLFFQGAAGNVNPSCSIGGGGAEQYDDLHRLGAMLAGETLKTWAQIRTHNRHGPRRIVRSVAALSVWDYESVPEACVDDFSVTARELTLPLAALPSRAEAEKNLRKFELRLDDAEKTGSQGARQVARRLVDWAKLVVQTIDAGKNPPTLALNFWAFRVNDIAIAAVSGEPFAELGMEVKRSSPFARTIFLGYSNGCIGYLPTPEAFDEGGMEVYESHQNYLLPAQLTPEWGPAVVRTSLEMLESLR